MKIIKYNKASDIVIEFQDEYKFKVDTIYANFKSGSVKNPYWPSLYGVGILGSKYRARINGKFMREYYTWAHILERCFDKKLKKKQPAYNNISCCDEWLCYENFYEWLHSQPNFDKWYNGSRWAIDKDILVKGNKIYSPETCCLVPSRINNIFEAPRNNMDKLPIGVYYNEKNVNKKYSARCRNSDISSGHIHLGSFSTVLETFYAYKSYKENLIKQIAEEEYSKGNITKQCYEAMMNYKVEITD